MRPAQNTCLAAVATIAVLLAFNCRAAELDLQSNLETILNEEGLSGVAWSLVGENGEVSLGAIGMRDNRFQTRFTIDTRFHVGSLTKSLLAIGVLRLATEGMVELDAPASRYLPNISFDNPWNAVADVTVRHLLDHTSGLDDARLWQMFSERAKPEAALIAAFPDQEAQLRLRSRPGARFSYSNMGYTLVGMIIESVVGGRYETYLDERILAPLVMNDSTFGYTTQEGESADLMLAWGHVDDGSRYAASPMFLRPAGQFTSTAGDLARFAQFLLNDGVIGDQQFINKELMRSRGQPSGTEAANSGLVAGYALGLGRRDRHGVIAFCHGGNIGGFVAMLCVFPDENKAFTYSVNTDSETADYGRIDSLLIGALGVAEASPPRTVEPALDIARWHGRYILSPNRFQAFEYLDNMFGAIKISADGSFLTMTSLQQSPRRLRPAGGRIYSANDRETSSHVFLQGKDGEYLISDGFKTYEKVSTAYLVSHWTSVLLGLGGIIWIFLSGVVSIVRYRTGMLSRPEAPAFVALVLLFVPIPFFLTQSFMALGDLTLASVLLAAVTLLLPIGMLLTIIRAKMMWSESRMNMIHGLAAVFVLQWCAVLIAVRMLPLRLWI
ncbi:MAG: serine hydrolase domain-containing protein [Halieaceae bacterium]